MAKRKAKKVSRVKHPSKITKEMKALVKENDKKWTAIQKSFKDLHKDSVKYLLAVSKAITHPKHAPKAKAHVKKVSKHIRNMHKILEA